MSEMAHKFYVTLPLLILVGAVAVFFLQSVLLDWHKKKTQHHVSGGGGLDRRDGRRFAPMLSNTTRYSGTAFAVVLIAATAVYQYSYFIQARANIVWQAYNTPFSINRVYDAPAIDPFSAFYLPSPQDEVKSLTSSEYNTFNPLILSMDTIFVDENSPIIIKENYPLFGKYLKNLENMKERTSAAKEGEPIPRL